MTILPEREYAILKAQLAATIASGADRDDWTQADPARTASRATTVAAHILACCGITVAPEPPPLVEQDWYKHAAKAAECAMAQHNDPLDLTKADPPKPSP